MRHFYFCFDIIIWMRFPLVMGYFISNYIIVSKLDRCGSLFPRALFGSRVFVGISGDNPQGGWVNPYLHPIPIH
jgi:hypothetical protein